MAAGLEGAGPEHSFGINIRLPFEQDANQFISSDPKLVSMKYFFTRKLLLVKESNGYAVLPGGFGTLDEAFELLTLLQTGKAQPSPVVLLEVPEGSYWHAWERFVSEEVAARGLVGPQDASLYLITDDVGQAVAEILGFYRNYHSLRWVGDRFVFQSEVFFDSGAAVLRPEGRAELDKLASALLELDKQIPSEINWVLRVDGHTDIRPVSATSPFKSNWELSASRAISVVQYLISKGVSPQRLVAAGFGEFQPIDPTTTEDAFSRNRRIELKLTER